MRLRQYAGFAYHTLRLNAQKNYRVPLTINLQLLLQCPFACLYCPQDHSSSSALSLPVVKGIIDDARELGGQRVHLTGGEPAMREDLEEIVAYAKGKGFFVSMTTSGARFERQAKAIKQLDQVQLSFDGPMETRGVLRGPAAAEISQRAVEFFVANGIDFWTSTVLTRVNIPYIDWIVDHARQHHIQANFVLMEAHPEDWTPQQPMPSATRELFPSPDENRQAVARLIELKKEGAPIGSSMPYLRELLEWKNYDKLASPERSRRYRCVAPQSQVEILANGDVHVCDWTLQRGAGVSVLDSGFKDAFARLPQPTDCHSCIASCYLETNLMFSLNPSAVLNWAKRLG